MLPVIPIAGFRKAMHPVGLLLALLLVLSCGSTRVVVMPEYSRKKGDGKTLVVAPFGAHIANLGDVTDDLGPGDPERIYMDWARRFLAVGLKKNSSFSEIVVDSSVVVNSFTWQLDPTLYNARALMRAAGGRSVDLETRTLPLRESSIVIPLPLDGARVEYASTMADLVLFLNGLTVWRDPGEVGYGHWVPGPPGTPGYYSSSGGRSAALIQEVDFAIWDNQIGKLVAYGKASSRTTVIIAMRRNTWKQGFEALAESILNQTPYYHRARGAWEP